MKYVNAGASIDGRRFKTKRDLKLACRDTPVDVVFDCTSVIPGTEWSGRASEIPEGVSVSVAGPDPYTDRKWYAQVTRVGNKVTVK